MCCEGSKMEARRVWRTHPLHGVYAILVVLLVSLPSLAWRSPESSKSEIAYEELSDYSQVVTFLGNETATDYFKILLVEGDTMMVGARNYVYNMSIKTLEVKEKIPWFPPKWNVELCRNKRKTEEQCQNYISVIARISDSSIMVCGTNAYGPSCRTYIYEPGRGYQVIQEESGIAKCPFDPNQNSTAIAIDGELYSGTAIDGSGKYPLIYKDPMRTQHGDSLWLNNPNFVSTFEYEDKVYFFFREAAVEYINCGKAVYSRVARVCKNDNGGSGMVLHQTWTSFFKTRLNCSIPGEYPFYFNEIQSTSDLGQGNYMATHEWNNRTDMIYGVFTTPQNSISGSAICAFKFSDIIKSFEGTFKEQREPYSAWLPLQDVREIPKPHPGKFCPNASSPVIDQTLNFIKNHPLMDAAVPAFGGRPILMQTSFDFRLTAIAVDWQVLASSGRSYDVLFVGTDDGRVLKAVNVAVNGQIQTEIIEDIEVFPDYSPVSSLRIYREGQGPGKTEKLIVTSKDAIKSIDLQRCHLPDTCKKCVALQDPYCSWVDNSCQNKNTGTTNILTGESPHLECGGDVIVGVEPGNKSETTDPTIVEIPCDCGGGNASPPVTTTERRVTVIDEDNNIGNPPTGDKKDDNRIPIFPPDYDKHTDGVEVGATKTERGTYTAGTMAIATVVSIVISLFVGFVFGYRASIYKHRNDMPYIQRKFDQRKSLNINDSGFNYVDPTYSAPPEKQLNVVFNPLKGGGGKLPNGSAETKVQPPQSHKVKKVYL